MKEYSGIAEIYDYLMRAIDFEGWIDYVEDILSAFQYKPNTVLDLACGTGNTILPMAKRGYRSWGLDISSEMIKLACEKAHRENLSVEFIVGDMRDFATNQNFDLVTCFHDGLNYLTNIEDIKAAFKCVEKCLKPGGMFIFDLNAVYWLAGNCKGTQLGFADDSKMTLIWETSYQKKEDIWDIKLTAFLPRGELYKKIVEKHSEKAYRPEEIEGVLKKVGLNYLASYNAFTFDPVEPESRRYFFVARKPA